MVISDYLSTVFVENISHLRIYSRIWEQPMNCWYVSHITTDRWLTNTKNCDFSEENY